MYFAANSLRLDYWKTIFGESAILQGSRSEANWKGLDAAHVVTTL